MRVTVRSCVRACVRACVRVCLREFMRRSSFLPSVCAKRTLSRTKLKPLQTKPYKRVRTFFFSLSLMSAQTYKETFEKAQNNESQMVINTLMEGEQKANRLIETVSKFLVK